MFKLAAIMTFPFAAMKDTVGTPQGAAAARRVHGRGAGDHDVHR
jgi:hypothetical protein